MTIVVGIPACARHIDERPRHLTPARYADALIGGSGALPVMIPPMGEPQLALLDRIDGLLDSRQPEQRPPLALRRRRKPDPRRHDPARDATTLPLIRAAIARASPSSPSAAASRSSTSPWAAPCIRTSTTAPAGATTAAARARSTWLTVRSTSSR